jgi:hypothetical protein
MGKAVIELEIGGVLAEVRVLGRLEAVVLIEELEMEGPTVGDVGVIRVKRHLREQRP